MDCRHLKAMETTVEEQIAITPSLCEAVARLMPQLSAHWCAPSAGLLRRLCASPAAALFVARQDGRIVDVKISYPADYVGQMLAYSRDYSFLPNVN